MSDSFHINGLGGDKILKGEIKVRGAKNAALKAMASSILFKGQTLFTKIPDIEDVSRMADLLKELGGLVERKGSGEFVISTDTLSSGNLASDISKKLRASIILSGPLLARFGKVSFPHPGGCVIGTRPIDLFIEGFEKMGAVVKATGEGTQARYEVEAKGGRLKGTTIFFRNQSVTGTETFMMAGVLAEGETIIQNSALEPEILSLAEFLNASGANITGAGTSTIHIRGTGMLSAQSSYVTPPDRIEAGSFVILSALLGDKVTVTDCEPKHMESLLELLSYSGVSISRGKDFVTISSDGRERRSVNVKTHEYPGFPTDLQAPMVVYLTQATGESLVFETIFEERLHYVETLRRMGADIRTLDAHRVIVKGPTMLRGKVVESPDLRAGLAFVIAGIVAEGESVVENAYNIDRGYDHIEERLRNIGVSIDRVSK